MHTDDVFEITCQYDSSDAPTAVEWTKKMDTLDESQATAVSFEDGSDYSREFDTNNTRGILKKKNPSTNDDGIYFCKFTFSEGTSPEIFSDVKVSRKYLLNCNQYMVTDCFFRQPKFILVNCRTRIIADHIGINWEASCNTFSIRAL